jgi:hypothetical protein
MRKVFAVTTVILSSLIAPAAIGGAVEEFGRAVFSEVERRLIRDYYNQKYGSIDGEQRDRNMDRERPDRKRHKHKNKGKGKESSGSGNPQGLPPGIAKKLARGGSLPPGIAKKNLPTDLEHRLPPVRDGYERREVDGTVVLVEAATDTIVDIIRRAERLDTDAKADKDRRPSREPAQKMIERGDAPKEVPKTARSPAVEKSWWEFWKD